MSPAPDSGLTAGSGALGGRSLSSDDASAFSWAGHQGLVGKGATQLGSSGFRQSDAGAQDAGDRRGPASWPRRETPAPPPIRSSTVTPTTPDPEHWTCVAYRPLLPHTPEGPFPASQHLMVLPTFGSCWLLGTKVAHCFCLFGAWASVLEVCNNLVGVAVLTDRNIVGIVTLTHRRLVRDCFSNLPVLLALLVVF